ncbi:hypothetical protein FB45DRAFT_106665 [Roridomyces roridus]|uniref:Tautomerase cis-CaaD-like domain-containing protein n=1 Tax=Roridomyces roridus TaxID=1738132 RepID=A0AAD7FH02_9AGAR|nr:hypothetical protein FB45DRAFT_106665 [Roridomyces roridus]
MPLYEVWHSCPLTQAQHADLAERITTIHTTVFTVPAAFVHVRFTNCGTTEHYLGGKKRTGTMNMVIANVRTGSSRSQDQYESLCRQVEAAWIAAVGAPATQAETNVEFAGIFIHGVRTAGYEQGFMRPLAGGDSAWIRENLPQFQTLADGGNVFFQGMIAELKEREDFKSVFES